MIAAIDPVIGGMIFGGIVIGIPACIWAIVEGIKDGKAGRGSQYQARRDLNAAWRQERGERIARGERPNDVDASITRARKSGKKPKGYYG